MKRIAMLVVAIAVLPLAMSIAQEQKAAPKKQPVTQMQSAVVPVTPQKSNEDRLRELQEDKERAEKLELDRQMLAETKRLADDTASMSKLAFWALIVSSFVAAVGIIQTVMFIRSTRTSQVAADAANISAVVARDTLRFADVAYLKPSVNKAVAEQKSSHVFAERTLPDSFWMSPKVEIFNGGEHAVTVLAFHVGIVGRDIWKGENQDEMKGYWPLLGRDSMPLKMHSTVLARADLTHDNVKAGDSELLVLKGWVRYKSRFGKVRVLEFAFSSESRRSSVAWNRYGGEDLNHEVEVEAVDAEE